MAREITYNNFEISLVVFMPNTTTNHAITYTNSRFVILSQKLKTSHRIIFLTSNERFKASFTLECFFVSRRSVRLKLKLFYENFFVDSLFVLLVNVTYFVDQNTNSQHGICKAWFRRRTLHVLNLTE